MGTSEKRLIREMTRPGPCRFAMVCRITLYFMLISIFGKYAHRFSWLVHPEDWRRRKALYEYLSDPCTHIRRPEMQIIDKTVFYWWGKDLPSNLIITYRKDLNIDNFRIYVSDAKTCDCLLSDFHVRETVDGLRYNKIRSILERTIYQIDPPNHLNCRCLPVTQHPFRKD